MTALVQQAKKLQRERGEQAVREARGTYIMLLRRHADPEPGDAELLLDVCERLGQPVDAFGQDCAVVAAYENMRKHQRADLRREAEQQWADSELLRDVHPGPPRPPAKPEAPARTVQAMLTCDIAGLTLAEIERDWHDLRGRLATGRLSDDPDVRHQAHQRINHLCAAITHRKTPANVHGVTPAGAARATVQVGAMKAASTR